MMFWIRFKVIQGNEEWGMEGEKHQSGVDCD
jgi:hypothetical protein